MKIAIVGSRNFPDLNLVRDYVKKLPSDTVIVSGGASGVDKTAESQAKKIGLKTEIYKADWEQYGKSAGYRRNEYIVSNADRVVAFWFKKSKGTGHSIELAKRRGRELYIFEYCIHQYHFPSGQGVLL